MFVLCPHCHFLVGIDPRTGAPPANCPKCGGMVVAALPPSTEDEAPAVVASLDPFAAPVLPSLVPPEPAAPDSLPVPAAEPAAPVPPGPLATGEAPAKPVRKPRARPRRSDVADTAPGAAAMPVDTPLPALADQAPSSAGASAVMAAEVAIDMLPPAVQPEDVVAPPSDAPMADPVPDVPLDAAVSACMTDGPDAFSEAVARLLPPNPPPRVAPAAATAPNFIRRGRPRQAVRAGWRSLAVAIALAWLLGLQLLLAQRDTLAADARWRPTIAALCGALGCTLPPWREPAAFTMLSRDVRPHPSAPGTLLINASFRNDARWPQPWPSLLLTLSDLDGRMVGARAFAAGEYLDAAPTQNELAPGQTAAVTLAVVEPAPRIVAFTFDFR